MPRSTGAPSDSRSASRERRPSGSPPSPIRAKSDEVRVDVSSQTDHTLDAVLTALRAAVAARKTLESPADRSRREQAIQALQALREPT